MSYSVIDVKDFEGLRTPVAQALGAVAIRANQFDSQPNEAGHEHDELRRTQAELRQRVIEIRENHALRAAQRVHRVPDESRRVAAGDFGGSLPGKKRLALAIDLTACAHRENCRACIDACPAAAIEFKI